jgi:monoamine oxidase
MHRRELLKKLMAGLPGAALLPGFLTSCSKELVPGEISFDGEVIIVGAGIAGLYAARILSENGIRFKILEASGRIGGRISSNSAFSDIPVETGALKIRGQRSVFYDLVSRYASEAPFRNDTGAYYLYQNQIREEFYIRTAGDLAGRGETLFQMIDSLGSYPGSEKSLKQYLIDFPINESLHGIANALVGNANGSDSESLGMFALKESVAARSAGLHSFALKSGSFSQLLQSAFPAEINQVAFNQVVNSIDYSGSQIEVTTTNNELHTSDAVILTVPLSVLKNNSITFVPELPVNKSNSIQAIGFGKAITVNLKFSASFWNSETSAIYGGNICPEYLVSSKGKDTGDFVLTGYLCGASATAMNSLTDQQIADALLAELSAMYPGMGVNTLFTGQYLVKNWSSDPFIQGGVSYPSPESKGQRVALAESISGKLFFAGEACNVNGHEGTVHGAMETAYIAVASILNS